MHTFKLYSLSSISHQFYISAKQLFVSTKLIKDLNRESLIANLRKKETGVCNNSLSSGILDRNTKQQQITFNYMQSETSWLQLKLIKLSSTTPITDVTSGVLTAFCQKCNTHEIFNP